MVSFSGDWINAAGVKRMAFQQAFECHDPAFAGAVFQYGLGSVRRARRVKPAARPDKRRNG